MGAFRTPTARPLSPGAQRHTHHGGGGGGGGGGSGGADESPTSRTRSRLSSKKQLAIKRAQMRRGSTGNAGEGADDVLSRGVLSTSDVVAAVAAEAMRMRYSGTSGLSSPTGESSGFLRTLVRQATQRIAEESEKPLQDSPRKDIPQQRKTSKKTPSRMKRSKLPMPVNHFGGGEDEEIGLRLTRTLQEVDVLREARVRLVARSSELEGRTNELSGRCESLEGLLATSRAATDAAEFRAASIEAQFASLLKWAREEEIHRKEAEEEASRLSTKCREIEALRSELAAALQSAKQEERDCRHRLDAALEDIMHKGGRIDALDGQSRASEGEANALRALLAGRDAELGTLKMKLDAVMREAKSVSDENVRLKQSLSEALAQKNQASLSWEGKLRDRDRALGHKQEETAALTYRVQQMEARLESEARRRRLSEPRTRLGLAGHDRIPSPERPSSSSGRRLSSQRPQPVVLSDDDDTRVGVARGEHELQSWDKFAMDRTGEASRDLVSPTKSGMNALISTPLPKGKAEL
jgi:hypothetical protein